jgi:hypothetical protein
MLVVAAPEKKTLTEDLRQRLRAEFMGFQKELTEPALREALRLLSSPRSERLTAQHVHAVAEYRPIEVEGERFFERAWSRSKAVAAALGFALLLGTDVVRQDLLSLAASVGTEAS